MLPKNIMDQLIPKSDTSRGAPMGRDYVGMTPGIKRVYNRYVPMSSCGAYDRGGAYWGLGGRLRVAFTADLKYVRFYREEE